MRKVGASGTCTFRKKIPQIRIVATEFKVAAPYHLPPKRVQYELSELHCVISFGVKGVDQG